MRRSERTDRKSDDEPSLAEHGQFLRAASVCQVTYQRLAQRRVDSHGEALMAAIAVVGGVRIGPTKLDPVRIVYLLCSSLMKRRLVDVVGYSPLRAAEFIT
jgi:hypothetical protein